MPGGGLRLRSGPRPAGGQSRPAPRTRPLLLALLLLFAAPLGTLLPGCDREAASKAAAAPLSPREVLSQLIHARTTRNYAAMTPLIAPGRAREVVEVLLAMDEFLAADARLRELLRDQFSPALADAVSQAHVASSLDIFSTSVELLDTRISGDGATVAFTIAGRLPPERATLRRIEGAWRYDPGAGYSAQLPEAFRRMARGLRQMREDLENGRLDVPALRQDVQSVIAEVRTRLLPGIKLLPPPPTTGQAP